MPLIIHSAQEEDISPNAGENAVDQAVGQENLPQNNNTQPLAQPIQPQPIQEPEQNVEQPQEKKGLIKHNAPSEEEVEKKQLGIIDRFKLGLSHSVSGRLSKQIDRILDYATNEKGEKVPTGKKAQVEDPTFFQSIVQSVGEVIGDVPYIAAGGALGSALGSAGGPVGSVLGAGAGSMAFPAFLKTAIGEYQDFVDTGQDLTFGEFLQIADKVGSETLKQGTFGAILGPVSKYIGQLSKVPILANLFNTKYVGPVIKAADRTLREATALSTEAGIATVVGAALDGRMPTMEDLAINIALFGTTKLAHGAAQLPAQTVDLIKNSRSRNFNLALAQQIEQQNLAYPARQEFYEGNNRVYKNGEDLNRNLAAFSESFVQRVTSQIEALSPQSFESSHDAGVQLKGILKAPELPTENATPTTPTIAAKAPIKPTRTVRPLIENPVSQAINTIAERPFTSDAQAGREITDIYNKMRAEAHAPLSQRYDEFGEQVRGVEFADEQVISQLENFVEEWSASAVPGSQEATVLNNARRLLGLMQVTDAEGNVTGIRAAEMRRVISTIKSMKRVPKWNMPGEVSQNLQEVIDFTEQSIVDTLERTSPELATEYNQLRGDYAHFKQRFDSKDMGVFYDRTNNAKFIYDKFSKLDQFNDLSEAIGGSTEGDNALNKMRRDAWTKGMGEDVLNARTEAEFVKAIDKLNEREYNNLMEYLTPQQQVGVTDAIRRSNNIRQSVAVNEAAFEASQKRYQDELALHKANKALTKDSTKKTAQKIQTKQEMLVGLLKEDPAKLTKSMDTIHGIQNTREILKDVKGGTDLFDALTRFETENMFDFMRVGFEKDGRVPFNDFQEKMSNKEFRAKLKELNGPEFVKNMDQLADVTKQLSKNYKEARLQYRNDVQTYNSIVNVATLLGIPSLGVIPSLQILSTKKAIGYGIKKATSFWDGKNYDQAKIKKAVEAAKAINSKDANAINNKALIFLQSVD